MSKRRFLSTFKESFVPITEDGKSSWNNGANINKLLTTTLEAKTLGETLNKQIMCNVYPIGSVMVRYDNINPSKLPGLESTKWQLINSGRYIRSTTSETERSGASALLGGVSTIDLSTNDTSLSTSTSTTKSHILTTDQIPAHSHLYNITMAADEWGARGWLGPGQTPTKMVISDRSGSGATYTNMSIPPFTIRDTGGSKGHTHEIPSISLGSHKHTIPRISVEPQYEKLAFWKRMS